MKIVHIITRLIVGGAQENTLLSCKENDRLLVVQGGMPLDATSQ